MNDKQVDENWLAATEQSIGTALVGLVLVLPEGRHYVASLRKTVRCLLESVHVHDEDLEDIELAIGELAANAMMHGGAPFTLGVNCYTDRVILIMADRGDGFAGGDDHVPAAESFIGMPRVPDLTLKIQTPAPATGDAGDRKSSTDSSDSSVERFGGWGLPVVHRITDHVEVLSRHPRGTVIRAEKQLRPGPVIL